MPNPESHQINVRFVDAEFLAAIQSIRQGLVPTRAKAEKLHDRDLIRALVCTSNVEKSLHFFFVSALQGQHKALADYLGSAGNLPEHVSLYELDGRHNFDFVLRGMLRDTWAVDFAKKIIGESRLIIDGVRTFQAETAGIYRWDTSGKKESAYRPLLDPSSAELKEFIKRKDLVGRKIICDPGPRPVFSCLTMFRYGEHISYAQLREKKLHEPIRDFFRVRFARSAQILANDTPGIDHILDDTYAIAVCEFEEFSRAGGQTIHRDGMAFANAWRADVCEAFPSATVEVVPYTCIRESHDLADEDENAKAALENYPIRITCPHLMLGHDDEKERQPVDFPVSSTVIVGTSGTGKSVVGCVLAADCVRDGYDVFWVSYKDRNSRRDGGDGPGMCRDVAELAILAKECIGKPILLVEPTDDSIIKSIQAGDSGTIYYTEANTSIESYHLLDILAMSYGEVKRKSVIVLDEILNGDEKASDAVFKAHNQWRSTNRFLVILHQGLTAFSAGGKWGNIIQESNVLLRKLTGAKKEKDVFELLIKRADDSTQLSFPVDFDSVTSLKGEELVLLPFHAGQASRGIRVGMQHFERLDQDKDEIAKLAEDWKWGSIAKV